MVYDGTAVFPKERAIGSVHCLNEIIALNKEHYPITDQGCKFIPGGVQSPRPGKPEFINIIAVDLVKWTIPPVRVVVTPHEPFAGSRIQQILIGHGRVVI